MGGHEVHVFRGGKLRSANEVPFVLPVGVVGAEDHFALAQVLQGLFDGVVLKHGRLLSWLKSHSELRILW